MSSTPVFSASSESIRRVAELLNLGETVALPTETVYGLAANALLAPAVLKIFAAKERPSFDPLIVHVSERVLKDPKGPVQALADAGLISTEILQWNAVAALEAAMKTFWPGPLTFILPRGPKIPDEVTSGQETVGIRCPAHPLFQAVLTELDFPLAAPSANRFGRISPTCADHVVQELDGRIAGVLDGGTCPVGVESTIIQIEEPLRVTLLRPGKIGSSDLQKIFKTPIGRRATDGETSGNSSPISSPVSPGLLDEHYAPRKPLILIPASFSDEKAVMETLAAFPPSEKDAILAMQAIPPYLQNRKHSVVKILSPENSAREMAQTLFATMRELDQNPNVERIICDLPNDGPDSSGAGLSSAIRDRLRRASRNKPAIN